MLGSNTRRLTLLSVTLTTWPSLRLILCNFVYNFHLTLGEIYDKQLLHVVVETTRLSERRVTSRIACAFIRNHKSVSMTTAITCSAYEGKIRNSQFTFIRLWHINGAFSTECVCNSGVEEWYTRIALDPMIFQELANYLPLFLSDTLTIMD